MIPLIELKGALPYVLIVVYLVSLYLCYKGAATDEDD